MPYKTVKQDCKRSDGRSGKYVLKVKPKPGKYKGRKRDSKGFVRIGCHTSKDAVTKQRAAIEAPPREGVSMKITAGQLRQIIKEELGSLNEQQIPQDMLERLNSVMISVAERVVDGDLEEDEAVGMFREIVIGNAEGFIEETLLPMHQRKTLPARMQQAVDTLANEEVFQGSSAENLAMQSLDYVEHHPSLADEAYEIALAAAKKRGFPSEGR